ncbi:ATP-binding protein [Dysgonomonas mossii]|uniref:ATP-binding protein n=1 Tax=Dysgonomonas mossii TaxID=163665 RepID=UPI00399555E8
MSGLLFNYIIHIIGEKTIADAVLDRIVHQSLRVELHGESLRRKKSNQECLYL